MHRRLTTYAFSSEAVTRLCHRKRDHPPEDRLGNTARVHPFPLGLERWQLRGYASRALGGRIRQDYGGRRWTTRKSGAGADRSKINMQEDYEVKYWTHELGITSDRLQHLVDKVGNSAAVVRKELQR